MISKWKILLLQLMSADFISITQYPDKSRLHINDEIICSSLLQNQIPVISENTGKTNLVRKHQIIKSTSEPCFYSNAKLFTEEMYCNLTSSSLNATDSCFTDCVTHNDTMLSVSCQKQLNKLFGNFCIT